MIIQDAQHGQLTVLLEDDGTIDTVVSVEHGLAGREEFRYDCEYAAQFRDESGVMTEEGFKELADESIEAFIENRS